MDRELDQMQFLGFFGIFKESNKIIISLKKIFTQITLTLILPLSVIFLAEIEILSSLIRELDHNEHEISSTPFGTERYNKLLATYVCESIGFLLFVMVFLFIIPQIILISTTVVVYTIASVYTEQELTFKKVISFVSKVWARLDEILGCMLAVFSVYFYGVIVMLAIFKDFQDNAIKEVMCYVFVIIYTMVFVYITVICQLASVVTVLESSCGFKAMSKSMDLIKGNQVVAFSISLLLNMSFILILFLFGWLVVQGNSSGVWKRIGFGVLCSLLLLAFFLFKFVTHTILYLVCKSYHNEKFDKGEFLDNLENYLGDDHEPQNGKEVQLEEYHV